MFQAQLAGVAQLVIDGTTFLNKTIIIDADIDLNANLWTPIGPDHTMPFSGSVEGNGHIIHNLWINMPTDDFAGLFGYTAKASFTNLNIDTSNIIGFDNTATLVANLFDGGMVDNCSAINFSVTGNNNTGGLVGGFLTNSTISKSHANGDVFGATQVGGLAGSGWDKVEITECYSQGTVTSDYLAGGLVGAYTFSFGQASTVDNSYSRSAVVANVERAGGLIGGADNALNLKNSYATGTVSAPDIVGGVIGLFGSITVENVYFDTESSGTSEGVGGFSGPPSSPDITGKTTAEMKSSEMVDLLNAGSPENHWSIDPIKNDAYPILEVFLGVESAPINIVDIKVFPSVFDAQFTISSSAEIISYQIFTIAGAVVSEGKLMGNTAVVNGGHLSSGLYILKVQTLDGTRSKKIIKS